MQAEEMPPRAGKGARRRGGGQPPRGGSFPPAFTQLIGLGTPAWEGIGGGDAAGDRGR